MAKSTLPILQAYKATRPKDQKSNRSDELHKQKGELLKSQLDAAKLYYEVSQKSPDPKQPYQEVMGNLRKSLGDKPTGWAAIGAGFIDGWNASAKERSILDDKKRLKAFEDTLSKMNAYSLEAQGRLAEAQKKENIKEGLSPYVSRTLDLIMEGAPQERIDLAGIDLARRLSAVSGDTLEYAMGNGNGLTLRNPETGEDTYVTWEDLAAPNIQEKVMMANPVYQSQLLRQQQMDEQEMLIKAQNSRAYQDHADFRTDFEKQWLMKLLQSQGSEYGKDSVRIENENEKLYEVKDRVDELKYLLNDPNNKIITGDTLKSKAEKLFGKLTGSKAYSDTELYDAIAGGLFSFVKGEEKYGNLNLKEFEFLTGRVPRADKNKTAIVRLLDQFDRRLQRSIERNNARLSGIPSFMRPGGIFRPTTDQGVETVQGAESSPINPEPPEAQNDSQALQKKLEEINAKIEALTQQ